MNRREFLKLGTKFVVTTGAAIAGLWPELQKDDKVEFKLNDYLGQNKPDADGDIIAPGAFSAGENATISFFHNDGIWHFIHSPGSEEINYSEAHNGGRFTMS